MSINPHFIRKYRVMVIDGNDVALDVSDLRVTFNIQKTGVQEAINYGDITIYNLSPQTECDIIKYGMRVIVEAGYNDGQYGQIFDGDVFQLMWNRENVVDYTLTLHCFDGDSQLNYNIVGMTVQASHDMRSDLLAIMKNARSPFGGGQIVADIDETPMPRGKVFFGMPKDYFRKIAKANNAQWYYADRHLSFSTLTNVPQDEAIVISPNNGLIGTPQQIEYGVQFRCLLNPAIKIQLNPMRVKLDMSTIRQQKIMIGQLPTRLDQDGIYAVSSLTHIGDTRGDDWYTDVQGFNLLGPMAAIYQNKTQNLS